MYFLVFRMKRLIVSDTFRVSCGAIFPFIFKNSIYVIITIFRIINLGRCIEAEIFSNFRLLGKLTGLISLFWLTIIFTGIPHPVGWISSIAIFELSGAVYFTI